MKRRQDDRRARVHKNPASNQYENMASDAKHHMHKFLNPEEKLNLGQVNQKSHLDLERDIDVRCLKATNHFAACSGVFANLQIGSECLRFCLFHVNQVMINIINIMFSGHIRAHTALIHPAYIRPRLVAKGDMTLKNPKLIIEYESEEFQLRGIPMDELTFQEQDMIAMFPGQTFGEWVVAQFDFSELNWKCVNFDFSEIDEFGLRDDNMVFFDFQDLDWPLLVDQDKLMIVVENKEFQAENDEVNTETEDDELNMDEPE
jgi:hypothetical protein